VCPTAESGSPAAPAEASEPSAREVQGAKTRERLLGAARAVLAEEGPDRFTTRRVAERAGVSHGMCHYHFKNKQDLVLALLIQARRDWIEPLEELVDGPGTPEARIRAVIAWMAEPATSDVMRVHTSILISALADDRIRERYASEYARWRAPFVSLFRELVRERGMRGVDPKGVGEAFAAAADGLVQQQAIDPTLPTRRILGRLLDGILASGAASPHARPSAQSPRKGR
jgi:AcrR family transcriptional regulator